MRPTENQLFRAGLELAANHVRLNGVWGRTPEAKMFAHGFAAGYRDHEATGDRSFDGIAPSSAYNKGRKEGQVCAAGEIMKLEFNFSRQVRISDKTVLGWEPRTGWIGGMK